MRINQIPGNKSDHVCVQVYNDDTVQINVGQPVVLEFSGTGDGVYVQLPSTINDAQRNQGHRFGVAIANIAVGARGEAMVFGFHQNLQLIRQTRAGTSGASSWATMASLSLGQFLTVDTVNNGFITAASTLAIAGLSASTATGTSVMGTVTIYNPDAVMAQTLGTAAGSATSSADSRTAITASVKAFVRMM